MLTIKTNEPNPDTEELLAEIAKLKNENKKLEKINAALIYRMEEGNSLNDAYRGFEQAVQLSEKVNQQTEQLNKALVELEERNHELAISHQTTKKLERRLNDAIESIEEPILLTNNHHSLTFFNSKFATIWGDKMASPSIGDDFYEVVQLAKRNGTIRRAIPGASDNRMIYQFSDNKWYQVTQRETKDEGSVILFNDVTEVKLRESSKYERVIRKKNQILQSLLDNIQVGILRVKKSGELEFWNDTFLRYTGLTDEEIANCKTISELNATHSLNGLNFEQSLSAVQKINHSLVLERNISVIGNSLLYTFADITSQYKNAETLRDNERWIRMITDNIPALIAYIGPGRNFLYTNRVYREWYGISELELQDVSLEHSHLRDILPRLNHYVRRVNQGETVSFSSEEKKANGENGILQKTYLPHFDSRGNIIGHFVLATDITEDVKRKNALLLAKQNLELRVTERTEELNLANSALREAIENKTKFIAALSHDLLQPLSAAILFNESLKNRVAYKDDDIVASLEHSLSDLDGLIRTLIDISKLDAGLMQPNIKRIGVAPLLQQLATEFAQISKDYNVDFRFRIQDVSVNTDIALFARILRNLLSNAMKYGANSKVLFAVRKVNNHAHFLIYDQGLGMTEEEQALVFKEFERLPNEYNYNQSLGLGLSIVEKMAKLLKHTVDVSSIKRRGSCFRVIAPLVAATTEKDSIDIKQVEEVSYDCFKHKNIWHIDNDLSLRLALQSLFESWDVELESYASYEQCTKVNLGDFEKCDILILDYHLDNDENGIEIARHLRISAPKLPLLMCTANFSKELEKQAYELKMPIIQKPISPLKLRMALNNALCRPS